MESPSSGSPRRFALVVSGSSGPELTAGRRDVTTVYSHLTDPGVGGCSLASPNPLMGCGNEDDFNRFIRATLNQWDPDDQLIFYYSGHGAVVRGHYCLVLNSQVNEHVLFRNLLDRLDASGVSKAILIIDACYSGVVTKGDKDNGDTWPPFSPGDLPVGIGILASSGERQRSREIQDGTASLFTLLLCEGLTSGLGGKPTDDGRISISQMLAYINDRLRQSEYAKYGQQARVGMWGTSGDLWLAYNRSGATEGIGSETKRSTAEVVRSKDELEVLFRLTHPHDQPCPDATVDELDWDLVHEFADKRKTPVKESTSREARADALQLYSAIPLDGRRALKVSAVLCFALRPDFRLSSASSVFIDETVNRPRFELKRIYGPLSRQILDLLRLTESRLRTFATIQKGERYENAEIDTDLIREIISNAIIHREYSIHASGQVKVRITDEYLEVRSPGPLPVPWVDLLAGDVSRPVNPCIAYYEMHLPVVDQIGRGMRCVKDWIALHGPDAVKCVTAWEGSETIIQVRRPSWGSTEDSPWTVGAVGNVPSSRHGLAHQGVSNLPFRSLTFVGRDHELTAIRTAFADGSAAASITGLGGIGKTRLALEYAHLSEESYSVRWWVRATDLGSLHGDLTSLGQRLGIVHQADDIERSVREVLVWLSSHDGWLLVYDDAENFAVLRDFLPNPCLGHVLVTSRSAAWHSVAAPINITQLSHESARGLLLRCARQPDDGYVDALATELSYLPLALVQAGAYINASRCSFYSYRELLKQHAIAVFRDPKATPGDHYEYTMAQTLDIGLTAIREENPSAIALLDWLSFLDADGVPLRLLRDYGKGMPTDVAECVASPMALDDAVAVLRRFGMVDRVEFPEEALRMHQLVQVVIRDKLGEEQGRKLALAVVEWVQGVFAYEPGQTPVSGVPEGVAEQLMAVGMLDTCVAAGGHALTRAMSGLGHYRMLRGMLGGARTASQRSLEMAEALAKAEPHSAAAIRELCVSLDRLGDVEVQAGNLAGARDLFQRSLRAREGLAKEDPNSAQAQRALSVSLDRLGDVEVQAGNLAGARDFFQRSLQTREGLVKADPSSAQAQRDLSVSLENLGNVELQAGNLAGARGLAQRSLETREGLARVDSYSAQAQRDLSVSLYFLGNVEMQGGNLAGARDLFERYRGIVEGLAKADPSSAQAQRDLSISLSKLGDVEVQVGNLVSARELFERSTEIAEGLAKTDSNSAQAQRDLSTSLEKLGEVEVQLGNPSIAVNLFVRSVDIATTLAKADSYSAQAQRNLSVSLEKLGEVEVQIGNLAAARDLFRRSLEVAETLAKGGAHSALASRDLSVCLNKLGDVELRAGDFSMARELFARSFELRDALAKADPHNAEAQRDLSLSLSNLGEVEVRMGNLLAARERFVRCSNLLEGLAKTNPHSAQAQRDLSVSLERLGDVEMQAGELSAARDLFQRSLHVAEVLAKESHSAQTQRDLSVSLSKLGDVEAQIGDLSAARSLFQRCSAILERLATVSPYDVQSQRDFALSLARLGEVEVGAGTLGMARDLLQRCSDILEALAKANPHSARAAYDLVVSLVSLARIAGESDLVEEQQCHLRRANSILDVMKAEGDFQDFPSFVDLRHHIEALLQ